jgi:hypothetical protein
MEYVINIETSTGEGLVFIESFEEGLPLYERTYIPFIGDDAWPLDILTKSSVINEFKNWFYNRPNSRIVSVMLAPAFDQAAEYVDKNEQLAFDLAVQSGNQCRIVMRDGVSELIGPGFVKNRVNLWVAKETVYRAEYF